MVTYYASSSEPASVRGKTVYIQYSNRHEIVNNKGPGDVPGNVLLVTIEGVEAGDVSIDVIHLVRVDMYMFYGLGDPIFGRVFNMTWRNLGTLQLIVNSRLFLMGDSLSCLKLPFNCFAPYFVVPLYFLCSMFA